MTYNAAKTSPRIQTTKSRVAILLVCWAGVLAVGATSIYSSLKFAGRHNVNSIQVLRRVRRPDQTITLIQFSHASGTASRIVMDQNTGKVLREREFPGRPQSSRQEFQQAVHIIRQDQKLAGLISGGAATEGGFIVDGPPGHPLQDRYIQIRLLTPDRRTLLRVVLVDLTAGAVASARTSFE
jgi:hypothetical protein